MVNSISPYFSDEDVCTQLRMQYSSDEMWNIDFKTLLKQVVEKGEVFELKIKDRLFQIDKITGGVSEVDV